MNDEILPLNTAKLVAKYALEGLIKACKDNIYCLENFADERMLVATADLQRECRYAIEQADVLFDVFHGKEATQ